MTKCCIKCEETKPIEEFGLSKSFSDGRISTCKKCRNKHKRNIYQQQREELVQYARSYRKNKQEQYLLSAKRTKARKYGIELEEYEAMLQAQGVCAICEKELVPGKSTHLDHCHETGKLRKFLCRNCNIGIGHFKDDSKLLQAAIDYLKEHSDGR